MKLITEGKGKYSIANLFVSNRVDEHKEYAMIERATFRKMIFIQIVFSAVIVLAIKFFGVQVDDFDYEKMKAYSVYIVAFVGSIYANMQALSHSNVETVIVFRACSPIAVTVIEYFFMDRAWPTLRSTFSLGLVAVGALIYCISDSQFAMDGVAAYSWVLVYFFLIVFEMTYGKKLTSTVKMESVWGPVLYCNTLAALPMFLLGYIRNDYENIAEKLLAVPLDGMALLGLAVSRHGERNHLHTRGGSEQVLDLAAQRADMGQALLSMGSVCGVHLSARRHFLPAGTAKRRIVLSVRSSSRGTAV
ncbi:unnamed protein product, partial [Sphagnum jensenii]